MTVEPTVDTDALRARYARGGWETFTAEDGMTSSRAVPTIATDVAALCDEIDRLRADPVRPLAVVSATVDRLTALLAEATPGPWKAENRVLYHVIFHRERPVAGGLSHDSADAALIAEARNALPDLLAAADLLRQIQKAGTISLHLEARTWFEAIDAALEPLYGAVE